jgi:hypothetical protein
MKVLQRLRGWRGRAPRSPRGVATPPDWLRFASISAARPLGRAAATGGGDCVSPERDARAARPWSTGVNWTSAPEISPTKAEMSLSAKHGVADRNRDPSLRAVGDPASWVLRRTGRPLLEQGASSCCRSVLVCFRGRGDLGVGDASRGEGVVKRRGSCPVGLPVPQRTGTGLACRRWQNIRRNPRCGQAIALPRVPCSDLRSFARADKSSPPIPGS